MPDIEGMKLPLLFGLLSLVVSPLVLLAQDAPAVNVDIILRDLDMRELQQKQLAATAKTTAIARIRSASASGSAASSLYMDAVEATQFEGKSDRASALSEWKSNNADAVRSRELEAVMAMHLKYLALSLERGASDKPELFVAPSLAYARELITLEQAKPGRPSSNRDSEAAAKKVQQISKELMDKSEADSVFAKWMQLGPYLPKSDEWELSAGNFAGILEKNVRRVLRKQKSPQLLETWDLEMQVLADRATNSELDYQAADFNNVVRPKMQFARANDMVIIGYKNKAINEIYTLVKNNPQHPDFPKWVVKLRELIAPPAPAAAAVEATAPSVPPGTAPQ